MHRCQTSPFARRSTPIVLHNPYMSFSVSVGASCVEKTSEPAILDT